MSAERIPEQEERTEFRITDDASADWVVQKLVALRHERADVKAQFEEIMRRIDSDEVSLLGRFGAELERYTRERLAADPRGPEVDHPAARHLPVPARPAFDPRRRSVGRNGLRSVGGAG